LAKTFWIPPLSMIAAASIAVWTSQFHFFDLSSWQKQLKQAFCNLHCRCTLTSQYWSSRAREGIVPLARPWSGHNPSSSSSLLCF
jgi:hypothetical protein